VRVFGQGKTCTRGNLQKVHLQALREENINDEGFRW
jgi:hypothetical protein